MVLERLVALGFSDADADTLAAHFLDAERRGKQGHGLSRVDWLETGPVGFDPAARPRRLLAEPGYERWDGNGTLGYLALAAIVEAQLADPPEHARLVVAQRSFPTGMLGYWARQLAEGGLVAALTATSPARLGHPEGGPKLAGTNPLAIAIPSSEGEPLVADVSISLGQLLPRAEAVIVTTPQPLAQEVAARAALMAQKTNMRLLGVVENMSGEAFGSGGGERLADELGIPLLGRVPLDARLREAGDAGEPLVESDPDAEPARLITEIAEAIAATRREQGVGIVKALPVLQ